MKRWLMTRFTNFVDAALHWVAVALGIITFLFVLKAAGVLDIKARAAQAQRLEGWILKTCLLPPQDKLCRSVAVFPTEDFCNSVRRPYQAGVRDLRVKCEYGNDVFMVDG